MPRYQAFGLIIDSPLRLPGPQAGDHAPDVRVRYGSVPHDLPDAVTRRPCCQGSRGQVLLSIRGVARLLVREGREIIVEPGPDGDEASLRCFLVTLAVGALLRQRGMLVLHASAVEHQGKGIVLAGSSGMGKSSLAAALCLQGLRLLSDQLCALEAPDGQTPRLLPAFPTLHLYPEALQTLGENPESLPILRPGLRQRVLSAGANFHTAAVPLKRLYILAAGRNTEANTIEPVSGKEAFSALLEHVYRPDYLTGDNASSLLFTQLTSLVQGATVRRLRQVRGLSHLQQTAAALAADAMV
jgi:hypothetical protein